MMPALSTLTEAPLVCLGRITPSSSLATMLPVDVTFKVSDFFSSRVSVLALLIR
ncbi:hypothetical protein D3C85_1933820 [compost metagenome]